MVQLFFCLKCRNATTDSLLQRHNADGKDNNKKKQVFLAENYSCSCRNIVIILVSNKNDEYLPGLLKLHNAHIAQQLVGTTKMREYYKFSWRKSLAGPFPKVAQRCQHPENMLVSKN